MTPERSPTRWVETEGPLGRLLREAAEDYRQGLAAPRALSRQLSPRRAQRGALVLAFVAGVSLAAAALIAHFRAESSPLLAQPEPARTARARPAQPIAVSPPAPEPSLRAATPLSAEPARAALPGRALPEPASASRARVEPLAPEPARAGTSELDAGALLPLAPEPTKQPAADCLSFARSGDAAAAERCFEAQAAGQNLSAEVALYELARLRRDMLGKPQAALAALDDYARRFPHGYLSGEVLFSRLELLVKLGRSAEVLGASDELLASASGKERALEIHFLRGNVYAHALKDPQSAAREYALAAASAGKLGDDAAFLAAVSLQSAGERARAKAAFEAYLARPAARHEAEARARLRTLETAAATESP
jgi:hypothetical protein